MGEVNNFITDLLDEFPLRYAEKLSLAVDRHPIYEANGKFGMSNAEKTDKDELREDLAALGVKLDDQYFLKHEAETGETLILRFSPVIVEGDLKGVIVKLINPSIDLQDALNVFNPISKSAFHEFYLGYDE